MNHLPLETRIKIIQLLVEGVSMRAASRLTGTSFNTIKKLLIDVGQSCITFHDNAIREIKSKHVEADELHSFIGCRRKNSTPEKEEMGQGDCWTYIAVDRDTKLVISWFSGKRCDESTNYFISDLASRLSTKVQLTTDGFTNYVTAVNNAFPTDNEIDYAQLVKQYGYPELDGEVVDRRKQYIGAEKRPVFGTPNPKYICTSHVERQNLTLRMHVRRFTRRTNAFSKKYENHVYSQAIFFVYYNFVKIHKSLSVAPAMQAGLIKKMMSIEDLLNLDEIWANDPKRHFRRS
jgi:IS1 family transposase